MASKIKKVEGKDLDTFMNQYFGRTWEHFDVNSDQYLDCNDMTSFMKYLTSDQSVDLDSIAKE